MRPRPSGQLVQVSEHLGGSSFPSGHAIFAATYATLLVLCIGGKYLRRRGLIATAAAGVAVALAFGIARIVSGGHWPSDVLGVDLLAGAWISPLVSVRFIVAPVLKWLMARMGYLSSALSYVLLALFAADIGLSASGFTASTGSASQPAFGGGLIATLEGIGLLYVIGAGVVVVGLGQLLDAVQAPFIH